jgi:hypothetical protein
MDNGSPDPFTSDNGSPDPFPLDYGSPDPFKKEAQRCMTRV